MKVYNASPTINKFAALNSRIQLLLGPIGGGKTTGVLMKTLKLAHEQSPNADGDRKTRWGVARNTRPQLRDSVLKTVFDWLPPDGKRIIWRESDMALHLNLPLPDGTTVKSEYLFRPLDTAEDAQRLLSVEYTGVWLSEFREIPLQLLTDALSRTGRYPSMADGKGATWYGVLGESNMPVRGSEWYTYLELERPEHCEVLKQPSALSPLAENLEFLPPDYYSTLMNGATARWIQAHIKCEYPDSLDGKAVYAESFDTSRHVSKTPLRPMHDTLVLMGVDQGRSPAAVFCQVDGAGRLRLLGELHASDCGMDKFARQYIRPYVVANFAGLPLLAVIDPAGRTKNDVNDVTPFDTLQKYGFKVITAPTNQVERRIEAVERFLLAHDGFLACPRSAPKAIEGLANSYRFKLKTNGEPEDRPEKRHPISDLQDALQYVALQVGGAHYGRVVERAMRRQGADRSESRRPPPPVRGWT